MSHARIGWRIPAITVGDMMDGRTYWGDLRKVYLNTGRCSQGDQVGHENQIREIHIGTYYSQRWRGAVRRNSHRRLAPALTPMGGAKGGRDPRSGEPPSQHQRNSTRVVTTWEVLLLSATGPAQLASGVPRTEPKTNQPYKIQNMRRAEYRDETIR